MSASEPPLRIAKQLKEILPLVVVSDLRVDASNPKAPIDVSSEACLKRYVPESRAARAAKDSERIMTVCPEGKNHEVRSYMKRLAMGGHVPLFKSTAEEGTDGMEDTRYSFLGYSPNALARGAFYTFDEAGDENGDNAMSVEDFLDKTGEPLAPTAQRGYLSFAAGLDIITGPSIGTTVEIAARDVATLSTSTLSADFGFIRASLGQEIIQSLSLPTLPDVLEIQALNFSGRFIVSSDERFEKSVPGNTRALMAIRPSMSKLQTSGEHKIEVVDVASDEPGRLSESLFLRLEAHVGTAPFEDIMGCRGEAIDLMSTNRAVAMKLLEAEIDPMSTWSQLLQKTYELLKAGHSLTDPYISRLTYNSQGTLKKRAREFNFPLPKSAELIAISDPANILRRGQVYVDLADRPDVGVLVDLVVVANFWRLHPDRSTLHLQAVDSKELRGLRNLIVLNEEDFALLGGESCGRLTVIFDPALVPALTPAPELDESQSDSSQKTLTNSQPPPPTRTTNDNPPPASPTKRSRRPDGTPGRRVYTPNGTPNSATKSAVTAQEAKWEDLSIKFADLRKNFTGRKTRNSWIKAARGLPEGANHPYCKELSGIDERLAKAWASDGLIAKINRDFDALERPEIPDDLVDAPWRKPTAPWACTPALLVDDKTDQAILRAEGEGLMGEFNVRFNQALQLDAENQKKTNSVPNEQDTEVFKLKQEYIDKYFPETDNVHENRKQMRRASAWYWVGYQKGKEAFAWLGVRYLNILQENHVRKAQQSVAMETE
ncbi:RNA-dependent RNA polymerase [Mycena chlorophos]|uniref:RNA-dependent RNA polymerase n=1 Tax=Mycena chlorophos TaxID=658473 RepID=A0A8H6VTW6_MYCCL|nr:RNA-dependent RNA polymerase [Mycena chlorophos]